MFRNSMYSSRLSASEPKGGGAFRSELDGTVNLPGVGGVEWVEERRRLAGDVPQLDVFIQVVGVGTEGRRGVHDLVDDDGSDLGAGVSGAEGIGFLGHEMLEEIGRASCRERVRGGVSRRS